MLATYSQVHRQGRERDVHVLGWHLSPRARQIRCEMRLKQALNTGEGLEWRTGDSGVRMNEYTRG